MQLHVKPRMLQELNVNRKVTCLLPVKNGMPYLPSTLASIEKQTYQDWEFMAWDNGSTDGSVEELRRWIPHRLPGYLVTDQPKVSLGECRSEMVRQCTTEFCAWVDADDISRPDRLEQQVHYLTDHPDIAVVGSQMNVIDHEGVHKGAYWPLPLSHDDITHSMLYACGLAQPTVMFRRSAVLQAGNYRDVGPVCVEDYDLWLRLLRSHKVANLDAALVNYRIHDKSATQTAVVQNRLKSAMAERFCEHAPLLFGCSKHTARQLFNKRHRCSIVPLYRIAQHLNDTQGDHRADRIRTESFVAAGRNVIASRDYISRLAVAALDKRRAAFLQEVINIIRSFLVVLGASKVKKYLGR